MTFAAAGLLIIAGVLLVLFLRSRAERRRYQQRMEGLRRELERLQRAFARFTPYGLVERIIDRGTDLAAEKREVTVLFADIKGFTQLTERLEVHRRSPAGPGGGYFAGMSEAVTTHHGHIARFIGDGIMALFGALEDNPWQVKDAVEAALAMRSALAVYNKDLGAQGLEPLGIGMGIHHGPVVAGVIGAEGLLQYDVHGDVVNVAARVESLTRTFNTDLLVTDAVKGVLNGSFHLREMPPTPVKGKSVPILTYAVDSAD